MPAPRPTFRVSFTDERGELRHRTVTAAGPVSARVAVRNAYVRRHGHVPTILHIVRLPRETGSPR